MPRPLPARLAAEIKWLLGVMLEYGDEAATRQTEIVRRALEHHSPMLPHRVRMAWNNCMSVQGDSLTQDQKRRVGELLHELGEWEQGKPGPPTQFPHVMNLRMDDVTRDKLRSLSAQSGEKESEIVRRLIREAEG
jgi:hypothetical protein